MVLDDDRWVAAHRVVLGLRLLHPRFDVVRRRERVLVQALRAKAGAALVVYPFRGRHCSRWGLPGHVPGHQLGTARGEQAVGVVPGEGRFPRVLVYFVGALVFNVSCIEPLELFADWPDWLKREMAWGAAEVGSLCFIMGAFVEVHTTNSLNVFEAVESGR